MHHWQIGDQGWDVRGHVLALLPELTSCGCCCASTVMGTWERFVVRRGVAEQSLRLAAALSSLGQTLCSVPHRIIASWLQCFSSNMWALDSLTEALVLFCCSRRKEAGVLVARCARSPTTYLSVGFTRQGKEKTDA